MFFLSSLGAGDGLYRLTGSEVTEVWRGARTALLEPPAIAPDGSRLALLLRREEGWHLHLVNADGTEPRRLTGRVEARGAPTWSPDGNWIATGGSMDGVQGLFKIPVNGGEPRQELVRQLQAGFGTSRYVGLAVGALVWLGA